MIAYISHKFDSAQRNYHTTDQECLAVIHALQEWRCYLEGAEITLVTDHQPLTHLQSLQAKAPLSRRHARWMETLSRYHFTWQYRKGSTNTAADALSRMHEPASIIAMPKVMALRGAVLATDLRQQLKDAYGRDNLFSDPEQTAEWTKDAESGLWYSGNHKVVVPASMRDSIMAEHHSTAMAGHQGVGRTLESIKRTFWWPRIGADVYAHVTACDSCQRNKASSRKKAGLLQPLPIAKGPWSSVGMDFVVGLPKTRAGQDAILVFVCRFSKMCHLVATTTNCTAEDAAILMVDNVVRLHGMPDNVVADRDPRWTGKFWKAVLKKLQTKLNLSTAYHPESDGQTERMNRVVCEALRNYVSGDESTWDEHLSMVEFAINNSVNASTKATPFSLNYIKEPTVHVDLGLQTNVPAAERTASDLYIRQEAARRCLKHAQERQANLANQKRQDLEFQVGDMVLLSARNLRRAVPGPHKFQPKWVGPFKVTQRIGRVAYKLELPSQYAIHPVFHVGLLKLYKRAQTADGHMDDMPTPDVRPPQGPGPAFVMDNNEYDTVQDIVGHRDRVIAPATRRGRGRKHREYLVRWAGYPPENDSWEPARELHKDSLVEEVIQAYCARANIKVQKS